MDVTFALFSLIALALGVYLGMRLFRVRKRRLDIKKQWENKKAIVHREIADAEHDLYRNK